jgi:hypothetical protein
LVNILILRLCNYDKSPDHVESAGKFTLSRKTVKKKLIYLLNKNCLLNKELHFAMLVMAVVYFAMFVIASCGVFHWLIIESEYSASQTLAFVRSGNVLVLKRDYRH